MIVDMLRNDLGRVAELGSVEVASLFDVERYPTLLQMTSEVRAHSHAPLSALLAALFPCASVTGAPKKRTMEIVAATEIAPRGVYTGAIGWAGPDGGCAWNVAIRTVVADRDRGLRQLRDRQRRRGRLRRRERVRGVPAQGPHPRRGALRARRDVRAPAGRGLSPPRRPPRAPRGLGALLRLHARHAPGRGGAALGGVARSSARRGSGCCSRATAASTTEAVALPPSPSRTLQVGLAARPVDPRSAFLYHKTTRREIYDEAAASRPDCDDVLLWNDRGELTESTIANVVVEISGQRLTPPVACGLLPGRRAGAGARRGPRARGRRADHRAAARPAPVAAVLAARLARGAPRRLRPTPLARRYTPEGAKASELVRRVRPRRWCRCSSSPLPTRSPAIPLQFLGGRLRLGGEVSGTIAPEDEGFFNYNDYETSTLRLFRIDLMAEARLLPSLSLLFDGRMDNLSEPRVYALYLRLRPWRGRDFDVQAGVVPPVFGSFPRRRYALDNPLPSLPLAYQYLTTIREDALPANAEEIVAQRGRGWLVRYPIGNTAAGPGPAAGERGALGRGRPGAARACGRSRWRWPSRRGRSATRSSRTRTAASSSRPASRGRPCRRSSPACPRRAATSSPTRRAPRCPSPPRRASTGSRRSASTSSGRPGTWSCAARPSSAAGGCPRSTPTRIEDPLDALGDVRRGALQAVARRLRRLAPRAADDGGARERASAPLGWDAPVTRVELGAGWSVRRHVLLKASWQHNWRDGGRVRENDLVAAQVLLWY